MRLLVTGSREWTDRAIIFNALDAALAEDPDLILIEGKAPGADRLAGEWARERARDQAAKLIEVPAHWRHSSSCPRNCTEVQGKAAGGIRNRKMLRLGPRQVFAFHENLEQSAGTLNCVYYALAEGLPTYLWDATGARRKLTNVEVGRWYRAYQDRKRSTKGLTQTPHLW